MDINHIAKLARIGLGKEEVKKLEGELSAILDFVGKLKRADAVGVEPMSGGTTLFSVIRDDELRLANLEERNKILTNVPGRRGDYIEILPVFE